MSEEYAPDTEEAAPMSDVDKESVTGMQCLRVSGPKSKHASKKRKLHSSGFEPLFESMVKRMQENMDALTELCNNLIKPAEASSQAVRTIFEELGSIPHLTIEHRIRAGRWLVHNKQDLFLFFTMPDAARAKFVEMILGGMVTELNKNMNNPVEATPATGAVFKELDSIPGLTLERHIMVAHCLVNNTPSLELFFAMPEEYRVKYVEMIIQGRFD